MNKKSVKSAAALLVWFFLSAVSIYAQDESELLRRLYSEQPQAKCGQRNEQIQTGKRLIELYERDPKQKEVVEFAKKEVARIEKEDRICQRNDRYNNSFKSKNWQEFFAVGKAIIAEENQSSIALDVMLDMVSIGYDRALFDKIDTFNNDTLLYAKLAVQLLEGKHASNSGKYGAFLPFGTKDGALTWMNYIAGWILYHEMNRKKDALGYFYKAALTGIQKKNDTTIYTYIGKYYFDEAVALEEEYRKKLSANNNEAADESRIFLALSRGAAERAFYFFAKAYKIAAADPKLAALKSSIRKTLLDLYRFRFNLKPEFEPVEFERFIEKLTDSPLPDVSTPVQTTWEDPVEVKLQRNKSQ